MNNQLTTALYLFSSLLQADATLLGLGAIFVIYKLQSIENKMSFVTQEFKAHGFEYIKMYTGLMTAKTDQEKASILKDMRTAGLYDQLESIVILPERAKIIRKKFIVPLFIIAIHLILSSIVLWLVPSLNEQCVMLNWISWTLIIWFSFGVLSAMWVAWYLVAKDKELSLEEINPTLYKMVHS